MPQILTCGAMDIECTAWPRSRPGAGSGVVWWEGTKGGEGSPSSVWLRDQVGRALLPSGLPWSWLVRALSGRLPSFTFTVRLFDPRSSFKVTSSPGFLLST